ncbi:MAG: bifunctional response regulator/alkaline phosphatase family protein [Bacteroidales bacterium]|jgi:CheY-like chemotaxis protein|nr:bifunctional response regulator/alkaline phosphatase family protein [Bacteroidales bacterium]MCB9028462.1 bifunctional response regulator/alkaline phosphatase family protein [Bacteroidales bacterium]MDD3735689.1 bifunctional response regulator/alkaline phosphatase family protein [Bacteroidales bacterium]NLD63359.1 bifunctional response regulator/alkaline phosphatase family protein [Bacteroidales bacterium]HOO67400.1 bifunctional response regulator/alkaline phosphatase family protein [Bactero
MREIRILWVDDEIGVLRPHILFLNERGFETDTCHSGNDAINMVREKAYDIIFLDEYMPGLSGIETLRRIKAVRPTIPVVMITKSEEEDIMDAAIGSQIADYLIKPVKPQQILMTLKRILNIEEIVTRQTTTIFREEFGTLSGMISSAASFEQWCELYRRLIFWQGELIRSSDTGMRDVLRMQEADANRAFAKYISANYLRWISSDAADRPLISPAVLTRRIFPLISKGSPLFFIVIDNMRLDQWQTIAGELRQIMRTVDEELYLSILPTTTQYSRNALFAGLMPAAIGEMMPDFWIDENDDEGKNLNEEKLLAKNLQRAGVNCRWSYNKISSDAEGRSLNEKIPQLLNNDLNMLVYNFVDLLSHARTEIDLIRDMTVDEASWLSLTRSWFIHSPLKELLRLVSARGARVVITTDHGSVRVQKPVKVIGDRNTSMNLRYKNGRNLDYNPREVFEITTPSKAGLPMTNISSRYIFACASDFLVYPNNYNHIVSYYRDSLQHGGVSMQEMLLPLVSLEPV